MDKVKKIAHIDLDDSHTFDSQLVSDPQFNSNPRTREALKKSFQDKAREFYDIVSRAGLTVGERGQDQVLARLQEHFRLVELQRIRTLPGHAAPQTASRTQSSQVENGRASTRTQIASEGFKKRFISEAVHELEHRYKCYGRARQVIERFILQIDKLQGELEKLCIKIMSDSDSMNPVRIRGSKLDAGIVQGSLSLHKIQECMSASYGHNSLYYTISHGSKEIYTSEKYHIVRKDQDNSKILDSQIRPIWNEFFSFTLSGDIDESLTFEIFRHNSCEGDLQLDSFEVKFKEDSTFFSMLNDQNNHFLQYTSTLQNGQQPSFETDKTPSSYEGCESPTQSKFKVLFKWRHSEQELKVTQFRKKITMIESKREEEESSLKDSLSKYQSLMQFKNGGAIALLEVWGVPLLHSKSKFHSPTTTMRAIKIRNRSQSGSSSPVRPQSKQDTTSKGNVSGRSSPYRGVPMIPTSKLPLKKNKQTPILKQESPKVSLKDDPYQVKNCVSPSEGIGKSDINLAEMLKSAPSRTVVGDGLKERLQEGLLLSSNLTQHQGNTKSSNSVSIECIDLSEISKKNQVVQQSLKSSHHKMVQSSSFKVIMPDKFNINILKLAGLTPDRGLQTERDKTKVAGTTKVVTLSVQSNNAKSSNSSKSSIIQQPRKVFNIPRPILGEKKQSFIGKKKKSKKKKHQVNSALHINEVHALTFDVRNYEEQLMPSASPNRGDINDFSNELNRRYASAFATNHIKPYQPRDFSPENEDDDDIIVRSDIDSEYDEVKMAVNVSIGNLKIEKLVEEQKGNIQQVKEASPQISQNPIKVVVSECVDSQLVTKKIFMFDNEIRSRQKSSRSPILRPNQIQITLYKTLPLQKSDLLREQQDDDIEIQPVANTEAVEEDDEISEALLQTMVVALNSTEDDQSELKLEADSLYQQVLDIPADLPSSALLEAGQPSFELHNYKEIYRQQTELSSFSGSHISKSDSLENLQEEGDTFGGLEIQRPVVEYQPHEENQQQPNVEIYSSQSSEEKKEAIQSATDMDDQAFFSCDQIKNQEIYPQIEIQQIREVEVELQSNENHLSTTTENHLFFSARKSDHFYSLERQIDERPTIYLSVDLYEEQEVLSKVENKEELKSNAILNSAIPEILATTTIESQAQTDLDAGNRLNNEEDLSNNPLNYQKVLAIDSNQEDFENTDQDLSYHNMPEVIVEIVEEVTHHSGSAIVNLQTVKDMNNRNFSPREQPASIEKAYMKQTIQSILEVADSLLERSQTEAAEEQLIEEFLNLHLECSGVEPKIKPLDDSSHTAEFLEETDDFQAVGETLPPQHDLGAEVDEILLAASPEREVEETKVEVELISPEYEEDVVLRMRLGEIDANSFQVPVTVLEIPDIIEDEQDRIVVLSEDFNKMMQVIEQNYQQDLLLLSTNHSLHLPLLLNQKDDVEQHQIPHQNIQISDLQIDENLFEEKTSQSQKIAEAISQEAENVDFFKLDEESASEHQPNVVSIPTFQDEIPEPEVKEHLSSNSSETPVFEESDHQDSQDQLTHSQPPEIQEVDEVFLAEQPASHSEKESEQSCVSNEEEEEEGLSLREPEYEYQVREVVIIDEIESHHSNVHEIMPSEDNESATSDNAINLQQESQVEEHHPEVFIEVVEEEPELVYNHHVSPRLKTFVSANPSTKPYMLKTISSILEVAEVSSVAAFSNQFEKEVHPRHVLYEDRDYFGSVQRDEEDDESEHALTEGVKFHQQSDVSEESAQTAKLGDKVVDLHIIAEAYQQPESAIDEVFQTSKPEEEVECMGTVEIVEAEYEDQVREASPPVILDQLILNDHHSQSEEEEESAPPVILLEVRKSNRAKQCSHFRVREQPVDDGWIRGEVYFIEQRQRPPTSSSEEVVPMMQITVQSQKTKAMFPEEVSLRLLEEIPDQDDESGSSSETERDDSETEEEEDNNESFVFITDLVEEENKTQVILDQEDQQYLVQQSSDNIEDIKEILEEVLQEEIVKNETVASEIASSQVDLKIDLNRVVDDDNQLSLKNVDEDQSLQSYYKQSSFEEEEKVVLQPTLENMKKMGLKNQRKDMEGSLATSNIVDLIQRFQSQRSQQDSQDEQLQQQADLHRSQMIPRTQKNNAVPPRFSMAGFGRFGAGQFGASPFGAPGMKPGAKSVIQEPMEQNKLNNKSTYSGQSAGARSIGMLMKSMDVGAHISRHAFNQNLAKQHSMSQESSGDGFPDNGGLRPSYDDLSDQQSRDSLQIQGQSASMDQRPSYRSIFGVPSQIALPSPSHIQTGNYASATIGATNNITSVGATATSQNDTNNVGGVRARDSSTESKELISKRLGQMFRSPLGMGFGGAIGLSMAGANSNRSNQSQQQ